MDARAWKLRGCVVMLLLSGAASAWAQPAPPPEPSGLLQGPRVEPSDAPPGVEPGFGPTGPAQGAKAGGRLPMRLFMEAVRSLGPSEHPLTPEQQDQMRAIGAEYRELMQRFAADNPEAAAKLRGLGLDAPRGDRPNDPGARRAPRGQRPPSPSADADPMRQGTPPNPEQVRDLISKVPDPAPFQARAWAVLTPEQRRLVEAKIEAGRATMDERRAEEYVQRRLKDRDARAGQQTPGRGVLRPDGSVDPSKLPPRLRERFEKMTPKEREQAIERFRARAGEQGPGARRRELENAKPLPAPGVDEVEVPEPSEGPV